MEEKREREKRVQKGPVIAWYVGQIWVTVGFPALVSRGSLHLHPLIDLRTKVWRELPSARFADPNPKGSGGIHLTHGTDTSKLPMPISTRFWWNQFAFHTFQRQGSFNWGVETRSSGTRQSSMSKDRTKADTRMLLWSIDTLRHSERSSVYRLHWMDSTIDVTRIGNRLGTTQEWYSGRQNQQGQQGQISDSTLTHTRLIQNSKLDR